jgi:hypothetical protein
MNCCDQTGNNCHQGRDCPVRRGYTCRRVRAGDVPPPDNVPERQAAQPEDEPVPFMLSDLGFSIGVVALCALLVFIGVVGK